MVVEELLDEGFNQRVVAQGLTTGHQYVILVPCGLFTAFAFGQFDRAVVGADVGVPGIALLFEVGFRLSHGRFLR